MLVPIPSGGKISPSGRARAARLPPADALLGPRGRDPRALLVGTPQLLAALSPGEVEAVADRVARLQAYATAQAGEKREDRFNAMLLVHTAEPGRAQRAVEEVLQTQAK